MLTIIMTILFISMTLSSVMVICAMRAPDNGWEQIETQELGFLHQASASRVK